jgi:hypothetical protein
MTYPRDDAPPTTSKHGDAADAATESLIDAKGSSAIATAVTINRPVADEPADLHGECRPDR